MWPAAQHVSLHLRVDMGVARFRAARGSSSVLWMLLCLRLTMLTSLLKMPQRRDDEVATIVVRRGKWLKCSMRDRVHNGVRYNGKQWRAVGLNLGWKAQGLWDELHARGSCCLCPTAWLNTDSESFKKNNWKAQQKEKKNNQWSWNSRVRSLCYPLAQGAPLAVNNGDRAAWNQIH